MSNVWNNWVNGALFFLIKSFYPKCFKMCITFPHRDSGGNDARLRPAHCEQLGITSLAQGHLNTHPGGRGLN